MRTLIPCDTYEGAQAIAKAMQADCSTLDVIVHIDSSGHRYTDYYVAVEHKTCDTKLTYWGMK